MEYLGWIPCLTGELGFSRIDMLPLGEAICPPEAWFTVSAYGQESGAIAIASDYDWTDYEEEDCDGRWSTLFLATVVDDRLYGRIIFAPNDQAKKWMPVVKSAIINFINAFKEAEAKKDLFTLCNEGSGGFAASKEQIEGLVGDKGTGIWSIDMEIKSNGLVTFKNSSKEKSEDEALTTAAMAYYYVKYVFHRHQHHFGGVDCVMTVSPVGADIVRASLNMVRYLRLAITDLKRNSYRRQRHDAAISDLARAIGIAAYAKSLVETLRTEKKLSDEEAQSLNTYFQNSVDSLKSKLEERKNLQAESQKRKQCLQAESQKERQNHYEEYNEFRLDSGWAILFFTPFAVAFGSVLDDRLGIDLPNLLVVSIGYASLFIYLVVSRRILTRKNRITIFSKIFLLMVFLIFMLWVTPFIDIFN